jgi:hypothetical protein
MTKLAKQFTGGDVLKKRQDWARSVLNESVRLAKKSEAGSHNSAHQAGTNYIVEQLHRQKNKFKALAALHYEIVYRSDDQWAISLLRAATNMIARDQD